MFSEGHKAAVQSLLARIVTSGTRFLAPMSKAFQRGSAIRHAPPFPTICWPRYPSCVGKYGWLPAGISTPAPVSQ
jgi:hypothetical protein